jgi:hypothetical protein
MSTKIIDNQVACDAENLITALYRMIKVSREYGFAVNLKTNYGTDSLYLSLEEETLTDGSKVYNIIVR